MTRIKICGITTLEDALTAAQAGADMLGFNFYRKSPRYITPEAARALCDDARRWLRGACPLLVGVFVNELVSNISSIFDRVGLHYAQLSGDESDDMLRALKGVGFKAIRPRSVAEAKDDVQYYLQHAPQESRAPSLLLDAYHQDLYGGTGGTVPIDVILEVKNRVPRLMLAGGLTPDNVGEHIRAVRPWGVDVASGVEMPDRPGKKNPEKVRAFILAVRAADRET